MRNQQYPSLSCFPLPLALKFHPLFPPPSTSKFRCPQVSHSRKAISDCEYFLDTRKCFHCRRERRAASDRARLVLRQFSRGVCQGGSESEPAMTRAMTEVLQVGILVLVMGGAALVATARGRVRQVIALSAYGDWQDTGLLVVRDSMSTCRSRSSPRLFSNPLRATAPGASSRMRVPALRCGDADTQIRSGGR